MFRQPLFLLLAHYVRFPGSFDTKSFRYKLKSIRYDIPRASTKTQKNPGPKFTFQKIPGGALKGGLGRGVPPKPLNPTLFNTKIAHFATMFKTGDLISLFCIQN